MGIPAAATILWLLALPALAAGILLLRGRGTARSAVEDETRQPGDDRPACRGGDPPELLAEEGPAEGLELYPNGFDPPPAVVTDWFFAPFDPAGFHAAPSNPLVEGRLAALYALIGKARPRDDSGALIPLDEADLERLGEAARREADRILAMRLRCSEPGKAAPPPQAATGESDFWRNFGALFMPPSLGPALLERLACARVPLHAEEFAAFSFFAAFVPCLVALLMFKSPALALPAGLLGGCLPLLWLGWRGRAGRPSGAWEPPDLYRLIRAHSAGIRGSGAARAGH